MNFKQIFAITGKPGLYALKTQTKSGFLALSLLENKQIVVGLRNNISLLSEISIYTTEGEMPLHEVFSAIKEREEGGQVKISAKSTKEELTAYFEQVIPNFDTERVYASDIKKIIQWYNLLSDKEVSFKGEQ